MRLHFGGFLLASSVVAALTACGAAGTTPAALAPIPGSPTVPASSADRTLDVGQAATFVLPAAGGFTSTLALPATPAVAGTQITVTSSVDAPAGFTLPLARLRHVQSTGSLSVLFYLTFEANKTVTFPTLPALTVALPAAQATAGNQFKYAISQPAASGIAATFRTEGPATVTGRTLAFAASSTPLTLVAHQPYVFAVFATSAQALVFVSNVASNTITAYALDANGNAAPVRTIAGPHTTLNAPRQIAQDAAGDLYVANTGAGRINVYPPGADGDAAPLRTIALPSTIGAPVGVAVDGGGDVYASTVNDLPKAKAVVRYAAGATGAAAPLDTALTGNYPTQLGLDASGAVYATYDVTLYASGGVTVYTPGLQPARTIQGPFGDAQPLDKTLLRHPSSSSVDGSKRLLVTQYGTILAFAPQAAGNVAPLFVVDAGAALFAGSTIAPDGQLYLASDANPSAGNGGASDAVVVYPAALQAGSKPVARISGPATQLATPAGITVGY